MNRQVHPDRAFLKSLKQSIADIANTISDFETVTLLAAIKDHRHRRTKISKAVVLWDVPTDNLWCRDSGPLFARKTDGRITISHLQFSGWGKKQVDKHAGLITARVAKRL